jgi:hypothetical protein
MSTAHDIWTSTDLASRHSSLLLPGTRFTFFAFAAIIAGAVLAFVT